MRRLFTLLTLCCLAISMAWADSESIYVYRNDGDFNYFTVDRLDSVVYSDIDLAGKKCSEAVVQEFWVGGKATRIPLAAIDSIQFVSPEENKRLVDPVRYKHADADATFSPNILIDYIESIQLASLDTTTWMAHLVFTDKVPELYKGAILYIPDEEQIAYTLRVLEAYQQGNEADVHVVPVGPEELIFNTRIVVGKVSELDEAAHALRSPSSRRKIKVDETWRVHFMGGGLSHTFDNGVTAGIESYAWDSYLNLIMDFSVVEFSWKGVECAVVHYAQADFKGDAQAECSLGFLPKSGPKKEKALTWLKVPSFHFAIPIIGPISIPVAVSPSLKAKIGAELKAGDMKAHQPFKVSGDLTAGFKYKRGELPKAYGERHFKLKPLEPTIEHTDELSFTAFISPLYLDFEITFCGFSMAGINVNFGPKLEYNARGATIDGQSYFQQKLEARIDLEGSIFEKYTDKDGAALISAPTLSLVKKVLWSEPKVLIDIDSVRHDFMVRKARLKRTMEMKAETIESTDDTQPKPVKSPNQNKVEVHTKSKIRKPNTATSFDEQGYAEWANEYQIVNPKTGTFKPIFENPAPTCLPTKQVIVVHDPETGEVIDQKEITPITAIKNFDIELLDVDNSEEGETYDTIRSVIKVRNYGEYVEEDATLIHHYKHGWDEPWHYEVKHTHGVHQNGVGTTHLTGYEYVPEGDGCVKKSVDITYPKLMGLGELYVRQPCNLLDLYLPPAERSPLMSAAEMMDALRWMQDEGILPKEKYSFSDGEYRGVECTSYCEEEDPGNVFNYWLNIILSNKQTAESGRYIATDTQSLIILPDTIDGEPQGEPIVVIASGGKSTNFGDGNVPESHVTANDTPNYPAGTGNGDDDPDPGKPDNSLGTEEWTETWKPGIYELTDEEEGETVMIAVSTDGWTYYIPNTNDHEGDNLREFDDLDYDYSDYTFRMPCGFMWCDRASTTYYYVENPSNGQGEVKEFHFSNRAAMCELMAEGGFGFVKLMLGYLKPEYMTRVAEAGDHNATYNTIVNRYSR